MEIHTRYETDGVRVDTEKEGSYQVVAHSSGHTAVVGFTDGDFEVNIGSDDLEELRELRDELSNAIAAQESGEIKDGVWVYGNPANSAV